MIKTKKVDDLIGKIHRSMKRLFDSQMKKHDITPPQFEVLRNLWEEEGLVLSELGRRLSRDGPTITGIIDRLEKKKLVKRKRSNRDRRVVQVYLTPKAWKLKESLLKMQQETAQGLTKGLSTQDMKMLNSLLYRIISNIEERILPKIQ